jgi:hypothetical protein
MPLIIERSSFYADLSVHSYEVAPLSLGTDSEWITGKPEVIEPYFSVSCLPTIRPKGAELER